MYGEGRYDYSINKTQSGVLAVNTAANASQFTTGSVSFKDINFNQEFSASLAAGELFKVGVAATTIAPKFDEKAFRSINIASSSANIINNLPQFTTYTGGTATLIVSASSTYAFGLEGLKVDLTLQPLENDRGDFEDTVGNAAADLSLIHI